MINKQNLKPAKYIHKSKIDKSLLKKKIIEEQTWFMQYIQLNDYFAFFFKQL